MKHPSLVERLTTVGPMALATLDDVVARLRHRSEVAGLLVWGSGANGPLKLDSDLDLLLVWRTHEPPFTFVTTWIGATLTEIQVVSLDDVRATVAGAEPAGGWGADIIVEALRGNILLDPDGVLAKAADHLEGRVLSAPTATEAFASWRHAQYNVRQTRRYLASTDADSRLAVEARMLYSLHDLLIHYFTVRGMRWRGDKEAVRYWRRQEPALLAEWRAAIREPEIGRQMDRYEACFSRVYAPLGGAAPADLDLVQPGPALTGDDAPARALRVWHEVVAE